jgi:vacuolar protein sorting-associated protein 26
MSRSLMPDIVTEVPFCVQNVSPVPTVNPKISMEVGIEDCLHIEFEYQKSKYVFPYINCLYYCLADFT